MTGVITRTLIVFFLLLLMITGCSDQALPEEIIEEEPEEGIVEEEIDEDDAILDENGDLSDPEAEEEPEVTPFPGSSFKHEVEMKIDGEVQENTGEEWYKFD